MSRIVKIQNGGHIGLKQSLSSSKLGLEKNSNWYTDPHCLVLPLSRFMLIFKVYGSKEPFLIADMRLFVLQACASSLYNIRSIICIKGAQLKATAQKYFQKVFVFFMNGKIVHTNYQYMVKYLSASSNIKRYAS